jgi:hypothetical protein
VWAPTREKPGVSRTKVGDGVLAGSVRTRWGAPVRRNRPANTWAPKQSEETALAGAPALPYNLHFQNRVLQKRLQLMGKGKTRHRTPTPALTSPTMMLPGLVLAMLTLKTRALGRITRIQWCWWLWPTCAWPVTYVWGDICCGFSGCISPLGGGLISLLANQPSTLPLSYILSPSNQLFPIPVRVLRRRSEGRLHDCCWRLK